MAKAIESFDEITFDWLEDVLDVPSGAISSRAIVRSWQTPVTQVALIQVGYKNTDIGFPSSIFVKIAKKEQQRELREMCAREVAFYSEIAGVMRVSCIPRCFHAVRDKESGSFTIVLEDLSETHFQTEYPLPPTTDYCEMAVECLASVHAEWWHRQGPESVLGQFPPIDEDPERLAYFRRAWEEFAAFMGDRLSQSRRQLIEKATSNAERAFGRCLGGNNYTLTHTDTHLWNFFFPKRTGGMVKLIDWQFFKYGFGVDDLIPMIALNWYPERRKRFEMPMLKKYHMALVERGIKDYRWEQLLIDYRWAVVRALAVPIWQWKHNVGAFIWYNNLERIVLAFQDLNCMELIE